MQYMYAMEHYLAKKKNTNAIIYNNMDEVRGYYAQ